MPFTPQPLGVDLIREERERQITHEGYTPEHDLDHEADDFVLAAMAYLLGDEAQWPWTPDTFKPTQPINDLHVRDLVKAGALIAAAIDRALDQEN
jgi:hypothetical protein